VRLLCPEDFDPEGVLALALALGEDELVVVRPDCHIAGFASDPVEARSVLNRAWGALPRRRRIPPVVSRAPHWLARHDRLRAFASAVAERNATLRGARRVSAELMPVLHRCRRARGKPAWEPPEQPLHTSTDSTPQFVKHHLTSSAGLVACWALVPTRHTSPLPRPSAPRWSSQARCLRSSQRVAKSPSLNSAFAPVSLDERLALHPRPACAHGHGTQGLGRTLGHRSHRAGPSNLCWKLARGLDIEDPGLHPTVLIHSRRRIAIPNTPGLLGKLVAEGVRAAGVLTSKPRRVVDSTVLADAVASHDTMT
jgi:hypothetical protein